MTMTQTVNGTAAYPAGMTQMQPALSEAQCSVNGFFQVEGFARDFQATGRGRTPQEAAANLKATIDETRAAFAPPAPAPVAPPSKEARVAALLACGIQKATLKNDWQRIERLAKAAALVLSGAVERCAVDGMYTVKSQGKAETWYDVSCAGVCNCRDYEQHATHQNAWLCKHGLACLMLQRLETTE